VLSAELTFLSETSLQNPFGFTGYQTDTVSGLQYAQARYYNPMAGRFTAEDLIKDGFNWYSYCANNPAKFIDPLGLWGKDTHASITHIAIEEIVKDNPTMTMLYYSHGTHIVTGNLAVDGPDYAALQSTFRGDFNINPGRHFNRAEVGQTDSRLVWGEHYLNLAINTWDIGVRAFENEVIGWHEKIEMQERALYLMGRGLHSIQDIEAHGDIGIGRWIAAHGPPGSRILDADDVNFDWGNSRRTPLVRSTEQLRLNISINDSIVFIEKFYRGIGMLPSLTANQAFPNACD